MVHSVSVFRLALPLSLCISLSRFLCQSPVFPLILKILLTQKALYLPGKFWCPGGFCSWHPPHSAGYVTGKKRSLNIHDKLVFAWTVFFTGCLRILISDSGSNSGDFSLGQKSESLRSDFWWIYISNIQLQQTALLYLEFQFITLTYIQIYTNSFPTLIILV